MVGPVQGSCGCFNRAGSLCSPLRPSRRHFPRVMPLSKPGRGSGLLLLPLPMVPMLGAKSPSPGEPVRTPGAPQNVQQARAPKSPWRPFTQHPADAKPSSHLLRSDREEATHPGWLRWPPSPAIPQGLCGPCCALAAETQVVEVWLSTAVCCAVPATAPGEPPSSCPKAAVPRQSLEKCCVVWDMSVSGLWAQGVHLGDG